MNLDLNLLRVFDVLLEERSVTRAGARLGLTQSAVSHALNRLRYMLSDELLVRGPSGMQPTPRALEMGPQVHAALTQLQAAIAPGDFDPASSERRFAIVAGAYACAVLAPPLVAALAAQAPLSELVIGQYTHDVMDRMDAHRVDFMVAGIVGAPERYARETLFTEDLTWVVRGDHPLARRNTVTLEALVEYPHVVISPTIPMAGEDADHRGFSTAQSWEDAGAFERALSEGGLRRRIGVTVPDTYSAVAVTVRSDMPALIPRRLALASAQSGKLALLDPPYQSPTVKVTLVYLKDRLAEPAVAWMRDLIRTIAAAI